MGQSSHTRPTNPGVINPLDLCLKELCGEIFCDDYYVKETEDEPDKKDVEPARNDLPDDFAKKAMEEALGRTTLLLMQDILMA
eukprot:g14169.t1